MSLLHRIAIIMIILLGAWLRFDAVTADVRFHPDEGLFATFARDAAVHGAWMLPGALDKPPLSLYASALSMHFFGVHVNAKNVLDLNWRVGEFTARLPNVFAGIVVIALTYALGCVWFGRASAHIAALLTALSPHLVAFSATAFTDTLMLTLMLAALVMAARGRPTWSGVCLALAFAAKQQAVFYLPLVVLALTFSRRRLKPSANNAAKPTKGVEISEEPSIPILESQKTVTTDTPHTLVSQIFALLTPLVGFLALADRFNGRRLLRFTLTFIAGLALLLLWDAARPEDSLFALAAVNNNPERLLIRPDEILPRLETWLRYASTVFGPPWLTALLIFAVFTPPLQTWRGGRGVRFYILAYFLLHWLAAFNTYDRYLLPIVPLLALAIGDTLGKKIPFGFSAPLWLKFTFVTVFALILLLSQTGFPTDDRARNREIVALADFLNAQPLGAIIYDHWLGWEMGYYIGAWSDKRRVYYPDAVTLAEDALKNPDPAPRWWIAPRSKQAAFTEWLDALDEAGFTSSLEYETSMYIAYEVIPPWAGRP